MVNLTRESKGREGKGKKKGNTAWPDQEAKRGREWGHAQRFNPRDAPAQDRNRLLRFHNLSNSATSCGPDVQTHVPLGNISNANLNYQLQLQGIAVIRGTKDLEFPLTYRLEEPFVVVPKAS